MPSRLRERSLRAQTPLQPQQREQQPTGAYERDEERGTRTHHGGRLVGVARRVAVLIADVEATAGSGVSLVMPAICMALLLHHSACRSHEMRTTGCSRRVIR